MLDSAGMKRLVGRAKIERGRGDDGFVILFYKPLNFKDLTTILAFLIQYCVSFCLAPKMSVRPLYSRKPFIINNILRGTSVDSTSYVTSHAGGAD